MRTRPGADPGRVRVGTVCRVGGGHRHARSTATWLGVVLALGLVVPAGVREARGGDVRTVKDRPYPEKFRRRVGDGIARALEHLHEQTQRPLWIHGDDARFRWSADVLWAFEREGRGLELQADEEIRARLHGRVPATVGEASRLILALCARPLPDGDPFSKRPPQRPALAEQDRGVVLRAVRLLLGAQVMRTTLPPGAEKDLRRTSCVARIEADGASWKRSTSRTPRWRTCPAPGTRCSPSKRL